MVKKGTDSSFICTRKVWFEFQWTELNSNPITECPNSLIIIVFYFSSKIDLRVLP